MNGRRREQYNGLYPGPYKVAGRYRADIAITAEGPEGPVVVGRIPTTKVIDAEAQAKAYTALPHMIHFLRGLAHSDAYGQIAKELLEKAGVEP